MHYSRTMHFTRSFYNDHIFLQCMRLLTTQKCGNQSTITMIVIIIKVAASNCLKQPTAGYLMAADEPIIMIQHRFLHEISAYRFLCLIYFQVSSRVIRTQASCIIIGIELRLCSSITPTSIIHPSFARRRLLQK